MRIKINKAIVAVAAATAILLLLLSIVAVASPEKTDKFGCHKCTKDCEKYGLLKNEFHCHGTVSVQSQNIEIAPRIYGNTTYRRVARIIDGDTLIVYFNGNQQVVRLLNINAPETSPAAKAECYSAQATEQLKKLAATKFVLLEKDKLQKEDKDKYGRLLRYVTVIGTNVSVNEELVNGGFAKAYPSLTTRVEEYKRLENEAKDKKVGMWVECAKEKKTQPQPGERRFPLKGERIDKYGEHQG